MNDPELVEEARRWLRFAMEDLDVAQRLLAADGLPTRHACSLGRPSSSGVQTLNKVVERELHNASAK